MKRPFAKPLRTGAFRLGPGVALCLILAACQDLGAGVGMFRLADEARPDSVTTDPSGELQMAGDQAQTRSPIIDQLAQRRSVLPPGPYRDVADAVISAASGAAQAELRVARLTAEAKSKNWLPQIGPTADLTSLGSVAASILVEQVLFDNGYKKAERAFAAADVEVAAVTLSMDMNRRVQEGLIHYIHVQKAREQARLAETAIARMNEYQRIVAGRIEGGLSDQSERNVIIQKTSEMQAALTADRNAAALAMAELNAMASHPLDGIGGLSSLPPDPGGPESLAVLKARGEGARTVAEAQMERAAYLPGLKATGSLEKGGLTGGLRLGADRLLGLGTAAQLEALEASTDVAGRREAEERQDAAKRLVTMQQEIQALHLRKAETRGVLEQTRGSLSLFTEQYKVGRRPLMELVGMYETLSAQEREHAALKYEIAVLQVKMAAERGTLIDGGRL